MRRQFIQKLKSEKGSSLAYVLIIGMVLLILVASLLAVANSEFTFTQETLESRQAYIDAKSVIEFGKIEINNREAILKEKNDDLNKLYQQRAAITGTNTAALDAINAKDKEIKNKNDEINSYIAEMKKSYYIGCSDENNVSGTLRKIDYSNAAEENTAKDAAVGVLSIEESGTDKTDYTFRIDTQNLSRKLDYKVDFGYEIKTTPATNNWTPFTGVLVSKPTLDAIGAWKKTNIYTDKNKVYLNITDSPPTRSLSGNTLLVDVSGLSLNIDHFQWVNNKRLNLTANNIYVTAPLPTKEDNQVFHNNTEFNMTAADILFQGNLEIGENVTVNLTCDNLWVGGDIVLGENSTLSVTGKDDNAKKQMIVNGVIRTEGDDCRINISNLAYFESKGLDIKGSDLLKLESTNIVIKGAVSLTDVAGSNNNSLHNEIKTQYFDCSGKTTISNSTISNSRIEQQPITFTPIDRKLVIRFAGGYDQQYSHVDINGADKVVFGKPFYLKSRDYRWYSWYDWYNSYYSHGVEHPSKFYWDHLYIESDNVYLEGDSSDSIQMTWGAFIYENSGIKVNIQSKVNFLDNNADNLGPGSYSGITHRWYNIDQVWGRIVSEDLTKTGDYSGSSGSSGAGEITNGAEIYY